MKLENKVAIVTGGASGIGQAIAVLYAKEGAKVVVADINLEAAQTVVTEITTAGGVAIAVVTNVAKQEDIDNLIDTTVKTYGALDILVNNAGIMDNFFPVADVTDELWDRVMAVNVTGAMRAIRKAMPIFAQNKKGIIINTASVGGLCGSRAGVAYTASKFAVIGLTKNIGYQYAKEGIRCNAIAPGAVKTNIGATITNPNAFGQEKAMSGMGINPRAGEPMEIAQVALFLASDDSSFVNGTVITADSGWTAY
jgi:NAD(P)-dependent dehydrogenase (short-subunit alcohol dehydrogenase family)